ncbi:MAG: ABC transporter permease [Prevotellaceae bacterium]|nr:ABC transporter permease [Prevotellaceae bacterium]
MNDIKDKNLSQNSVIAVLNGVWHNFIHELKTAFRDRGVVIMFILGPLIYPLLYQSMYLNEALVDVPIGIVDNSHSSFSHELVRNLDATESLKTYSYYASLSDAQHAFEQREIHGIVYIPKDINYKLSRAEQATISVYCDVSSFMYYRTIYQSCNYSILSMNKKIQIQRLNALGIVGESATSIADPMPYQNISLYNRGVGFASFLLPSILVLILFQTLFFGITMLAGTSREENKFHVLVSANAHRGGIFRVICGKSAFYFLIYSVWIFYVLGIVPQIFNMPHIGNPVDLIKLMIPFLLATIFFSMTISAFIPNRETSMILFMFFSVILLFLSGIVWPQSNINGYWRLFAWIFPSTHGVQGYIKINTMGADVQHASFEYISLWVQTAFYFVTTSIAYRWQIRKTSRKQLVESDR